MKIVIKYLKGTNHMNLTFMVDSFSVVNWWVDSSYNTHDACRVHTRWMMILVKGSILSSSLKQNINVKIYAEGGLVVAHDGMSVVVCRKYFIVDQVYILEQNIYINKTMVSYL